MYLKALTLRGFKSFASATQLLFEPGITAIVGPNGSGKSNIVDALSWVMGEQGAKSLRGGQMSDVIFQGTANRPALGRAEVTLTIDNSDGVLPIDYSEVKISRTLFRTGGSEYAINGQVCRLLDVQELLSDTGMGREMHVIVGQGQLDAILAATPEQHRGFIEEAAGVLKYRRRKERAQRKLEATSANMERLNDLISEVRRQLKPLGSQARVAKRAQVIQSELRDAKARLLADDLARATAELAAELADEAAVNAARATAELLLSDARSAELSAEQALAVALPMMRSTQEIWYELSALRERATTTWSIAAERLRAAEQQQLPLATRDLAVMDAETAEALAEQNLLELAVTAAAETLVQAEQAHAKVNGELVVAEAAYASTRAAAADRRDGLSRLQARSTAAQARLDAGAEESERLRLRATAEMERVAVARDELALLARPELQQSLIDAEVLATAAHGELDAARERSRESVAARAMATARSAALSGRIEALQLSRNNAAGKLQLPGLGGAVSESIKVSRGWELAVAAALGQAAAALTADTLKQGASALHTIAEQQLGRTGLLISGVSATLPASDPPAGVWLLELLQVAPPLQGAFSRLLTGFVALENVTEALLLVAAAPELTVVTKAGEIISAWFMAGGSSQRSGIELQAALDEAATELASATLTLERSERLVTQTAQQERTAAEKTVAADKLLTSLRSEVGAYEQRHAQLTATITAAEAAVARAETDIAAALAARVRDEEHLAEITARITAVTAGGDTAEPDPTERDRLAQLVSSSSHAELEARMGLRTAEERLRLAAERTAAFVRAAENERASQQLFAERMARAVHEAEVAKAVHTGAGYLLSVIENARNLAATERQLAEEARSVAETSLGAARARVRETLATLDELVAGAHRDEMLQVERKLRIEGLADRGVAEFGLDVETLLAEYGPDQLVPTLLTLADESAGVEPKPPVPYQRDAQLRRARKAENDLLVLGAINPLALEEFDALNARHSYLAGQLADITATHKDLLGIVVEVDMKVQEAFAAAFTDVAAAFENVFARLFPGGKGKLTLHNPDDMLTTGVLVSARPAGKKVERLALLSGGERSLVAIAFLLALFIARPSPFYILDEVEAALDETNLARLLAVYEELRAKSQLLIITHQKRTMEIADALYGITMKSDGVSKVVSQRLID